MTQSADAAGTDDYVTAITRKAISRENIEAGRCFACGAVASTGKGEHVIPLWLQARHALYDKKLMLLNGSLIPYRQLTIPCCEACNNGYLSRIESDVKGIVDSGAIKSEAEALTAARWLSKIFVGILVKETALHFDRRNLQLGKIVKTDVLKDLHHCHLVMQSGRKPTKFSSLHWPFPFSFYWYQVDDGEADEGFDLSTNITGQSIVLRAGRLGLAFINDGGMQMEMGAEGALQATGKGILRNSVQRTRCSDTLQGYPARRNTPLPSCRNSWQANDRTAACQAVLQHYSA